MVCYMQYLIQVRVDIPNTSGSVCVRGSLLGEERIEEEEFAFVPSPALRRWQSKMARLLRRQRERGGVIDLTNRDTVIDETWVLLIVWCVV